MAEETVSILFDIGGNFKDSMKDINQGIGDFVSGFGLFTGGVAAGAYAVMSAVNSFQSFERSMVQAGNLTGATGEEMRMLSSQMQELTKVSIFSTDELTQGLRQVQSATMDAAMSMDLLNTIQSYAASTGQDLGGTIESITDIARLFGMTENEVIDILEALSIVTGVTGDTIQELINSLDEDAIGASEVSFEDLASSLAALWVEGFTANEIINSINLGLQAIAGDTKAQGVIDIIAGKIDWTGETSIADIMEDFISGASELDEDGIVSTARALSEITALDFMEAESFLKEMQKAGEVDISGIVETVEKIKGITDIYTPEAEMGAWEKLGKGAEEAGRMFGEIVVAAGETLWNIFQDPFKGWGQPQGEGIGAGWKQTAPEKYTEEKRKEMWYGEEGDVFRSVVDVANKSKEETKEIFEAWLINEEDGLPYYIKALFDEEGIFPTKAKEGMDKVETIHDESFKRLSEKYKGQLEQAKEFVKKYNEIMGSILGGGGGALGAAAGVLQTAITGVDLI